MSGTKLLHKYGFSGIACIMIYWLSNAVLWIPWKYAAWLGAVCMLIYVPVAWGGISFLCLKKFSKDERIKAKYGLGLLFAAIAFISDLFFYVGYRHIPEQLYKPATFGAYILCFFSPLIAGAIIQKKPVSEKNIKPIEWVVVSLFSAVFVSLTFYVVRFW